MYRQGLHGGEDRVGDRGDLRAQLQPEVCQVSDNCLQLCTGQFILYNIEAVMNTLRHKGVKTQQSFLLKNT